MPQSHPHAPRWQLDPHDNKEDMVIGVICQQRMNSFGDVRVWQHQPGFRLLQLAQPRDPCHDIQVRFGACTLANAHHAVVHPQGRMDVLAGIQRWSGGPIEGNRYDSPKRSSSDIRLANNLPSRTVGPQNLPPSLLSLDVAMFLPSRHS